MVGGFRGSLTWIEETDMKQLVWEEEGVFATGGGSHGTMNNTVHANPPFQEVCTSDLTFDFGDGNMSGFSSWSRLQGGMWAQGVLSPGISATIDSQSSMCGSAGSPTSTLKPKSIDSAQVTKSTASGSSNEDDQDNETGTCEQRGTDAMLVKKLRRKVSNRESARRSRRRKQAHLSGLELRVDQLRGENASLDKQLTDASQQFQEATTDNRVLKSDVEALRVKVKLAQEYITRGTMNSGLNHLFQSHHISGNQALNGRSNGYSSDHVATVPSLQTTTMPGSDDHNQNFGMNDGENQNADQSFW